VFLYAISCAAARKGYYHEQYRKRNDAWGFVKEVAGAQIGIQIPTIAGTVPGGYLGQKAGQPFDRTGQVVGGFTGAATDAVTGMVHHHVSEMRRALQREKIEGPELADFTNYGAAVLVGLNLFFPVVAGLKWPGSARQAVADGVRASSIYKWFQEDFGATDQGVLKHLRRNAAAHLGRSLPVQAASAIDYDWRLNDVMR
jgi:hypothetical protein